MDFLSRRRVLPAIVISVDANEYLIDKRLPEGYILSNGLFRFPAGYWENYFVNGKMYNPEGDRSLDEQRELIARDLSEEGFTKKKSMNS